MPPCLRGPDREAVRARVVEKLFQALAQDEQVMQTANRSAWDMAMPPKLPSLASRRLSQFINTHIVSTPVCMTSMDDPLGYVVEKMVQKTIEDLFDSPDFLEELRLASMPGALSSRSSETLRDYFSSDSCAISRVCTALFEKTTIAHFFSLYGHESVALFQGTRPTTGEPAVSCSSPPQRPCLLIVPLASLDCLSSCVGILFQIGRESMKELTLRFCDDLFCDDLDQQALWDVVPYQILAQVFPCTTLATIQNKLPPTLDLAATSLDYKFPLMLYTCDFVTDLIQENRPDTVGRFIVLQLTTNPILGAALVDGVLNDLQTLPSPLSCESYGMKVLNSMLQLHHCGCISRHQDAVQTTDAAREVDCQGTLNALWTAFLSRLPAFLDVLHIPPHQNFSLKHVQLLYLLYPVLRVSCIAVDELLMQDHTFEQLLVLVERYPNANILHTAICRLFITCLEDCPVMFGQELQTRRTIWDPLRNSLLTSSILGTVIAGCQSRYVTCFKDIAMSFDELMMQTPPVAADLAAMWHDFATTDLEDIRAEWAINLPTPNGTAPTRTPSLVPRHHAMVLLRTPVSVARPALPILTMIVSLGGGTGVENHLVQLSKQSMSQSELLLAKDVSEDDFDTFPSSPTAAALVMDSSSSSVRKPPFPDPRKLAEVCGPTTTTGAMAGEVESDMATRGETVSHVNLSPTSSPKKDSMSPLQALYDPEEQDLIRQFSKMHASDVVR
ncbi:hypothetical protein DYB32_004215 [Aphanomyces invadans]|uniref:Uncharacterized protein n=1 Tax=Aphanomyces invadans TaxID=157072 RepID=A0A3R7D1I9_9STRA|nr:hypothetical protein DYB32_004215 [Aphanomyces invadans]